MYRLAVVVSHPVQYQVPWFKALARATDLEVFFCHRQSAAGQSAAGFGVEFEWDVPLLDGYSFTWLQNRSHKPDVSRFSGCDTPAVGSHIREGRFDACIVCGWYLKSYLQAIWACKQSNVRVMSRGDSQLATARSAAWRVAKYLPYRALLNSFDAHLYVGQANKEYLQHYGVADSRLFFTPHFVDNEFFKTRASVARKQGTAAALRRELGISKTATVFAFVGKLVANKRAGDLVRALAKVRARGLDVCGLIIGSGALQTDIEALAAALEVPVCFAGFRNQTEIPAYLAVADALVLPSENETWGLVVNEAMACGLPAIVSTAAGCVSDLIDEGKTGYCFPSGDVDRLSEALVLLENEFRRDRPAISESVAAKIRHYSCEAAVAGTLEALDTLVTAGSQRQAKARAVAP